jgi:ABC-2 type transport system permease protein
MNRARTGAVVRKELTDIRRSRFVVVTMAAVPLIYVSIPVFLLLTQNGSATSTQLTQIAGGVLTDLMLVPLLIPVFIASSSVVGEREQGTLEPVLTTPVTREEILTGKALAAAIPAIGVAYLMMGAVFLIIALFALPAAASAVWHAPALPAIAFITLADVNVIRSTLLLVIVLGSVLLLFDIGAYRVVSRLFDTERLVTGTKPVRAGKSRFS